MHLLSWGGKGTLICSCHLKHQILAAAFAAATIHSQPLDTLQALVTLLHVVYDPQGATAPQQPQVQQPLPPAPPASPSTQTLEAFTQASVERSPLDTAQVQPSTCPPPTDGATTAETEQEGGKAVDGVSIRQACLSHAVPALLCSMHDYTTDNRGDVGSLCDPFYGPDS